MNLKLITSALFLAMFIPISILAQPVKKHGSLSVKGTQMIDQKGNVTVLKGVSYGWHNWWAEFYNAKSVKWLATDWKCDAVRAAMGVEPDGAYLEKPQWSKEKVEIVVKSAIKNNIYVII